MARDSRDIPEAGSVGARDHFLVEARKLGSIFLLCVAIWLISGAGYFWPVWVLLFVGLKLGHLARHAYGTSASDDRYDRDDVDFDAPVRL